MTDTRERLLEAAGRLFASRGYDGVSVRHIVTEAQANLGAVTYHFGSKEGLFGEVIGRKVEAMRRLGEREIRAAGGDPERQLRDMLRIYALHVLVVDPELKALFAEMLAGGRHLPAKATEAVAWRNALFASIVRRGVAEGRFRPCDVDSAAWCFFGMLSAYMLYEPLMGRQGRRGRYPRAYVERVVDTALDLFLNGLKVAGGGARGARGKAAR